MGGQASVRVVDSSERGENRRLPRFRLNGDIPCPRLVFPARSSRNASFVIIHHESYVSVTTSGLQSLHRVQVLRETLSTFMGRAAR